MKQQELTDEEWELITQLRNYRRAYPNGKRWMKVEIDDLVAMLKDPAYQEEKN